ncbi:hypothetical protein G5C51_09365 [Streptomyces sp. A7024]|uniref:Uncharacterized protein n=1 Tax=Streptomyces coryli TaxID=1128680 RepID=A0A6G4TYN9_9ACTN|nr:hypothetical protein [Streptomyces coryli]NGN64111.1 hypothetical protein [Streptomyces coryli]
MYPERYEHGSVERPVTVHHPTPIPPADTAAPLVPVAPGQVPAVQSVVLPDGRVVTGYAIAPAASAAPAVVQSRPVVSRTAVNIALGGIGFAAICGGLILLTSFIAALAALLHQLIILVAIVFGLYVAVQLFGSGGGRGGVTVNARKAVFKNNHFRG